MTNDRYKVLSEGERLIYDEVSGFVRRLSGQQEEIIGLLKKILAEAEI